MLYPHTQPNPQHALTSPPAHQCLASLTRLTTLHLTNGATNEVLAALGECVHGLRELRVCYRYGGVHGSSGGRCGNVSGCCGCRWVMYMVARQSYLSLQARCVAEFRSPTEKLVNQNKCMM